MADRADPEDDQLALLAARSTPYLPFAVGLGAVALWWLRGPGAGVMLVAGALLLAAITALWNSLRTLLGEAPVDVDSALALSRVLSNDERTREVLAALKDLELERRQGKLTEEDYRDLSARYRAEAKLLLRERDEKLGPARLRAEGLLAERLAARAPEAPKHDGDQEPADPKGDA
ncbi:MAG: hypothetical protein IT374_05380 [Polyangiaceae bacterium]|nr:hypothetical protein [Polyangiaceae bacterium]